MNLCRDQRTESRDQAGDCSITSAVILSEGRRRRPKSKNLQLLFGCGGGKNDVTLPTAPNCRSFDSTSLRAASLRMTTALGLAALLFASGCRQDMHNEPKMVPQRGSEFFADGRGARPQVLNTVARGELQEDSYFYTGIIQGANGYRTEQNLMPFPVTMEVLRRGQERFNINCTPCHSRVGNGQGEIVQRGFKTAANLHDQVRLSQPLSHYFYVMTNGYGAMPDYSASLSPVDRWAVAAYIRALQLSQAAPVADVPAGVAIRDLKEVAAAEGHPEYAQPWVLPATAVQATAPVASEGTPAMAPASPASPKITIPVSKPAPAGQK